MVTIHNAESIDVTRLSLAAIDAVSRSVEWDAEKMIEGEWSYVESSTYTLADTDRDYTLISDGSSVIGMYTPDGDRITIGYNPDDDYAEYLADNTDDEGDPLPGTLTADEWRELIEATPSMYGAEGPMMNYFYPLNESDGNSLGRWEDSFDTVEAAYRLRDLPLCLVERDGDYGLALTGGGMDLTWEIVAAYVALGYLPPVSFSRLPGMAGMPNGASDRLVIAAVSRSLSAMIDRLQYTLTRHTEQYGDTATTAGE